MTKQSLDILLENIKRTNPELNDYSFSLSDPRCGRRIALISSTNYLASDYMLYNEMYYFLFGYSLSKKLNNV